MARIGAPPLSRGECLRRIEVIEECAGEGFSFDHNGQQPTVYSEAAKRLGISIPTLKNALRSAMQEYGLEPDRATYIPPARPDPPPLFTFDDLPHDGEPDAETLIGHLKARNEIRRAHAEASQLQNVRVNMDGPIGLAFFGDPHVDNPGCDWIDLERDVNICKNTEGLFAINLGDSRDNWVGRLMGLYANHEVTAKQALTLIEWLFTSLPWLVTVLGNHDRWGQEHGDAAQIMHRLRQLPGLCEGHGVRLKMHLPAGCDFTVHVRHDFPGGSQFNPAHALVRETLFGYRDHILACGHRHSTGYIPIWHNDPARLCHGFRVGTYKVGDEYAKEKGFKELNWAKSMAAVIDPEYAHDPVRYIKPFFSLEEAAEYLTWRRSKWASQRIPS
jgi:hypothetical protein